MVDVKMNQSWKEKLCEEFNQSYFKELVQFIRSEYSSGQIYPKGRDIFRAFETAPFEAVKVVILGQDPYHGKDQANGLSFSVGDGVKIPPSLVNIFKELNADLGKPIPQSGDLIKWARQGVLLLNATLTVRAGCPGSHQKKGWEQFTDAVIKKISDEREGIVFILWGAYAQKKGKIINSQKHLVITASHPSPFSAYNGFFGSKPFSKTNEYLNKKGKTEIDW